MAGTECRVCVGIAGFRERVGMAGTARPGLHAVRVHRQSGS